jgi:hypothetical protein
MEGLEYNSPKLTDTPKRGRYFKEVSIEKKKKGGLIAPLNLKLRDKRQIGGSPG